MAGYDERDRQLRMADSWAKSASTARINAVTRFDGKRNIEAGQDCSAPVQREQADHTMLPSCLSRGGPNIESMHTGTACACDMRAIKQL